MAANSWSNEREILKNVAGVHEVDPMIALIAQMTLLAKHVQTLTQGQVNNPNVNDVSCLPVVGSRYGGEHADDCCPYLSLQINGRLPRTLPRNTEENPRDKKNEQCQAITLRNSKEEVSSPPALVSNNEKMLQKLKGDGKFKKFLNLLRQVHINTALVEVIEEILGYAKFIKDMISKKRKFLDHEEIALSENYSAIVQNKLPPKLKNPGSFTISCKIGNLFFTRSFCDLRASINLMPLSVFEKLGLGDITIRLNDEQIVLNIYKAMKHPNKPEECSMINSLVWEAKGKCLETHPKDPLELALIFYEDQEDLDVVDLKYRRLMNNVPLELGFKGYKAPKPSMEEPPVLELKQLPEHLKYAFLGKSKTLSVIISAILTPLQKDKLLRVLREHKGAIDWTVADIKGISLLFFKNENNELIPTRTLIGIRASGQEIFLLLDGFSGFNQENYTTIKKELLPVVFAFENFRAYLVDTKVIVYTNHAAIRYLMEKKDEKPRLIRWILLLQEFDLEIKDRKGIENQIADHLSRLENGEVVQDKQEINDAFPDEQVLIVNSLPWFAAYENYVTGGILPSDLSNQQRRKFLHDCKSYLWDGPILLRRCGDQLLRRCVPEEEFDSILYHCQSTSYGGHFGSDKTTTKVLQSGFWWPSLFKNAHAFVQRCDRCQRIGNISKRNEMPLNFILEVEIFDVWGISFYRAFHSIFRKPIHYCWY
ncbi:uncharacterized protein [Rutidosis leptorrhynchoides]|uniref:uncharacterized protein n=1 Tax=Rutidosis leptorrhynchoides TaxID=125765 RepID=UPI003A99A710